MSVMQITGMSSIVAVACGHLFFLDSSHLSIPANRLCGKGLQEKSS